LPQGPVRQLLRGDAPLLRAQQGLVRVPVQGEPVDGVLHHALHRRAAVLLRLWLPPAGLHPVVHGQPGAVGRDADLVDRPGLPAPLGPGAALPDLPRVHAL
ncbi:hypothetical protein IWQ57_005621, partial [Coemansia nantahalensis]